MIPCPPGKVIKVIHSILVQITRHDTSIVGHLEVVGLKLEEVGVTVTEVGLDPSMAGSMGMNQMSVDVEGESVPKMYYFNWRPENQRSKTIQRGCYC